MGGAIGDVLPLALTVAIVPVSIISLVFLLLSRRARANAVAFTGGRILGLAVAVALAAAVAAGRSIDINTGSSQVISILKVVAGVVLILAGAWRWRRHRRGSGEHSLPRWMERLEEATPALSFGAGFLVSTLEPLTLACAVDAGLAIAKADLSFLSSVVVAAVFVLVAASTNIALLAAYLAGATRAERKLTSVQVWIHAHHEGLSILLMPVLGVILVGRGLPGVGG